ncbi:GntR family transcriptional regulator [Rubrimonas cliftonensis]|nr:GntR family transcriptional regulator [Rubrimonas cliftonensis]
MRQVFERRRPLVLEVRDELERMILCGEVAAGERLDELALAERLGVSRGPVREAARSLERDGLVTTVANHGVFVRKLSVEDALELYDLRALIAGQLCAQVAECADARLRAALRAEVTQMEAAIDAAEEGRYFELNLAFHDRIAAEAGAARTQALYASLGKEVRLMRRQVLKGEASLRLSNREHGRIVAAIEAGDADAARRAGAAHHLNGKARLIATL